MTDVSIGTRQGRSQPGRSGWIPALGGHRSGSGTGLSSRRGSSGVANLRKNIFIMQNHAFWCIFGSENWQLLTGADPKGTARCEG